MIDSPSFRIKSVSFRQRRIPAMQHLCLHRVFLLVSASFLLVLICFVGNRKVDHGSEDDTVSASLPVSPSVNDKPIFSTDPVPGRLSTVLSSACDSCMASVTTVADLARYNSVWVMQFAAFICQTGHFQPPEVCSGVIDRYGPIVLTVLYNRTLNPSVICQAISLCPPSVHSPRLQPIQTPALGRDLLEESWAADRVGNESTEANKLHFLHISDVHFDQNYKEGADTLCGTPLCCQAKDWPASTPGRRAGRVGEYTCDTSLLLLDDTLQFAAESPMVPPLQFVVYTGDTPPHSIWKDTEQSTTSAFRIVHGRMKHWFQGIPVYPALGNHGPVPADEQPVPPSQTFLHSLLWEAWSAWLPAECESTVRLGGYYTLLHQPGLRIVTINTQWMDVSNFWLQRECYEDPAGQFAWLEEVLAAADASGERVIITGHIPVGDESSYVRYSERYIAIVERFHSIILVQLFGHTHNDHFKLFRSQSGDPIGVALMTRSVTPYDDHNPSLRVFGYLNGSDRLHGGPQVIDYVQYELDLVDANRVGRGVNWRRVYHSRDRYGLKDLSPREFSSFIQRLESSQELWEMYIAALGYATVKDCVSDCKAAMLCYLNSSTFKVYQNCRHGKLDPIVYLPFVLNQWLCS